MYLCFFFFNDTATTEIYTLSLHDALPIFGKLGLVDVPELQDLGGAVGVPDDCFHGVSPSLSGYWNMSSSVLVGLLCSKGDRKSTRLNSSHANISYAVFCLKKKKHINNDKH